LTNNSVADLTDPRTRRIHLVTERIIQVSLVLYVLFAPHSIAATQTCYIIGLLSWSVQLVTTRKYWPSRTPVDVALLGFFNWCVISSVLSYVPLVSLRGLRSPSLFLAFYLISNKISSLRIARVLAFALIGSCLINVGYSAVQIGIGRGLQIDSIDSDSPLREIDLKVGDIILKANRQPVKRLDDITRFLNSGGDQLLVTYQRKESIGEISLSGETTLTLKGAGVERLGIVTSTGRNFRITGFYNHYESYAEVLALIASLAVGLLIAHPKKRSAAGVFLLFSILSLTAALLMTSTRAAIVGLATATIVMSLASFRFRVTVFVLLVIVVIAPLASFTILRARGISFIDSTDGSTEYRLVVWREALNLIRQHPLVGIGKGSDGALKEQFGLFDHGRLPPGHFHSTPIQIATWWGLPALACYAAVMSIFLLEGLKLARLARVNNDRQVWGIALGTTGAVVAFNLSSLVHWNFGDGEVVMALWLIAGLSFAVRRITLQTRPSVKAVAITNLDSGHASGS
jgi:O-Antigen ligase/PDZ domain